MTKTHELYDHALRDKKLLPVIAIGSAGTGKTCGAVGLAVEWLSSKRKVVVTRPNVSFADDLGYLPGTEREKMEPWIRPILQNFAYHGINRGVADGLEKAGNLTFLPLSYVQGLTFDNTLVVVDECQNMTMQQLKVMLTRVGKWSKIVLCGDVAQTSPHFKNSGLGELIRMVDQYSLPVHVIHFISDDIVRSEQCKQWICAFEAWETGQEYARLAEEV